MTPKNQKLLRVVTQTANFLEFANSNAEVLCKVDFNGSVTLKDDTTTEELKDVVKHLCSEFAPSQRGGLPWR